MKNGAILNIDRSAGLLHRDSWLESGEKVRPVFEPSFIVVKIRLHQTAERHGNKYKRLQSEGCSGKALRCDANNREILSVDDELVADHVWIFSEPSSPVLVTEYNNERSVNGAIIIGTQ